MRIESLVSRLDIAKEGLVFVAKHGNTKIYRKENKTYFFEIQDSDKLLLKRIYPENE